MTDEDKTGSSFWDKHWSEHWEDHWHSHFKEQYEKEKTTRYITQAVVMIPVVLFVCIAGSCSYKATLRANMVSNGANPIDVMCLEEYNNQSAIICMERARQPK